ncbi:hypothetical protein AKO1_015058 [Acrasis kona]|uniref:Mitochondrial carrier protein n=1 Tax=Acrasis kona TaxID=1008807 RepID=A0AAW2Z080_9EUKA
MSEPKQGSFLYHAISECAAGSIGGMAGVLVGHPWDTVRVRLQVHSSITNNESSKDLSHLMNRNTSSRQKLSFTSIFKGTVQNEGFWSLYRGVTAPLIGEMANNCVLFGIYGGLLRPLLKNLNLPEYALDFGSGALAGLCISPIVQPTELIKIRLQVNTNKLNELLPGQRGFWDCAQHVYKTQNGMIRGLFSGFSATLVRELYFNGLYFAVYEKCKRMYRSQHNIERGDESVYMLLMSGGIAGTTAWALSYPTDVIKSVMQADENRHIQRKTMRQYYVDCYKRGTLWKGLVPTLLRAYPVNAVTFLFYELVSRGLSN